MGCIQLEWSSSEVQSSGNSQTQTAYWRAKFGDGIWQTSDWSPPNPLDTDVEQVQSCNFDDNVIYQFKIENNCDNNGPTQNDNGIIEQIAFDCVDVNINYDHQSSTFVVDLANSDIQKVRFVLKKDSDNSTVYGPITINRLGDEATAVAGNLQASTGYYWQYILLADVGGAEVASSSSQYLNAMCGPYAFTTNNAPPQDLIWIPLAKACQKEGGFNVVKTISGLSSPVNTWYDEDSGLVYVADYDDELGNVYWFNPNTATLPSHMIHSSAVQDQLLYNNYIDVEYKRIYFVGANSNGLIVYDIETDTIATTVAFGVNAAFSRTLLFVTPTKIYCNAGITSIIIIDRATLTIDDTIPIVSMPDPARFNTGPYSMVLVNGEIWTVSANADVATVGIYTQDLSTELDTITLPGATTWDFGNYWMSITYDPVAQLVLVGDIGSTIRYTIEPLTRTIINTQPDVGYVSQFNKEGKTNLQQAWVIDPITNDLYLNYGAVNTSTDPNPIRRLYKENRVDQKYIDMFEGKFFHSLTHITGTNRLVGAFSGTPFWTNPSEYNDDGEIVIVSSAQGTANTGMEIVTTLQEVDANNNNNPTGETKPNVPNDDDFIPPEENLDECPVTVNLDCPVNLAATFTDPSVVFEFAIPSSVAKNPAIAKIVVYAYNLDIAFPEGTPIEFEPDPEFPKFFSGFITGLGGTNYSVQVRYLDVDGVPLKICSP